MTEQIFANHQQRNKGQLSAKDMQQYALNHDHKYGIYTGTHVMGTIQSMMGDYQEGIQNFRKAIDYLHKNFPNESAAASWIELARISLTNRKCLQAPRCRTGPEGASYQRYAQTERLQQMKSYTAKQIIDAFSQSVESHRNGAEPNDDLTMLAIKLE